MRILLTNDDGIYAEGINSLAAVLVDDGHEVIVAAPDRERSAAGHSITINNPLRANDAKLNIEGLSSYKINGTPADCVKLGLEKIIDYKPDFIISGINDGPNLGHDVLYSGTVSAAMEGFMLGISSIAISLAVKDKRDFNQGARHIGKLLNDLYSISIEKKILLNINIPDIDYDKIKGIKFTVLGKSLYEDSYEERVDPSGNRYYWIAGRYNEENIDINSDVWAVKNGFISITPIKIDLTDLQLIGILKKITK